MIDKELSELKKDLPEYDIDNYKSGIYTKYSNKKNTRKIYFPKLAFISIILIMFISIIGLSTYAIKVEAQEYQNAVEFFEVNELSLDGLTRYEIKEIYKDITTNKFEYKKTGEIIVESIKSKVPGYSIKIDNASSSELISVWELWNEIRKNKTVEFKSISYDYTSKSKNEDGTYTYVFRKYNEEVEEWSIDINHPINGFKEFSDSILVFGGYNYNSLSEYSPKVFITKLNKNGNIIWKKDFADSYRLYDMFFNDENYTIFLNQSSNKKNFKIIKLDCIGNIVSENVYYNEFDIDNTRIINLKNYYLAYVKNYYGKHTFIKINYDGSVENSFNYTDEKYFYHFTDMIEVNGKLYLSGYSYPVSDYKYHSNRDELYNIIETVSKMEYEKVTPDYILELFKENYKAILFECNNEDGELKLFYIVDSSLGWKFTIEDGNLIWEVETFNNMFFSPYTSSFTFGGSTKVYQYLIDTNGNLVEINDTGELREFRR